MSAPAMVVLALVLVGLLMTSTPVYGQQSTVAKPSNWVKGIERTKKLGLLNWLIDGCSGIPGTRCAPYEYRHVEYEGYDGWYNNFAHPELGAAEMPLLRKLPPAYSDGVYQPSGGSRPNPLTISETLMNGSSGMHSRTGKSALLVFFGQQVVEEILDAQRAGCPPEYFNIAIPRGHRYRDRPGHTELPFLRSRYDMANSGFAPNAPRQQLNEITPWLDGGLTYGTTKAWADVLRAFANGTQAPRGMLAWSRDAFRGFPERNTVRLPLANPPPPSQHDVWTSRHRTAPVDRFWMLGNPRGNENPFLLTFGVLWFRWHNHLAGYIAAQHPNWSSDRVFNEARKWVIATHQHIIVNQWLPGWLGEPLDPYRGYDDSVDPQITHVFQSAAMRFGHTLVTSGVYLRNYSREGCQPESFAFLPGINHSSVHGVRTCNSFWRPQEPLAAHDVDRMLMGMSLQSTEREDNIIVNDLRGDVFGPLEFSRRDLMAINIQRGRDHGLPDYLTARHEYGLPPVGFDNFTDVTGSWVNNEVVDRMRELYNGSMENVDIWAGGLLETTDRPGQLFRAVIADQFARIRNADRFWFENRRNGRFTDEEISRIRQLTIYDVIMSVTAMEEMDILKDPFLVFIEGSNDQLSSNCLIELANSGRLLETDCVRPEGAANCSFLQPLGSPQAPLEPCSPPQTYDYFSGSEVSFALTFLAAFLAVCGTGALLLMLGRRRQKQNTSVPSAKAAVVKDMGEGVTVLAMERVTKNNSRQVAVQLKKTSRFVEVHTMKGALLRSIDLSSTTQLEVVLSSDGTHVIIKVPKEYDLALVFEGPFLRDYFLNTLDSFLSECSISKTMQTVSLTQALDNVVTQKHRQQRLEAFFRVVFAQAFNITHNKEELLNVDAAGMRDVIHMELTLAEFADALSVASTSDFVTKMFNVVDQDRNGYISFREFLDMMVVFAKGSAEDKVRLMFNMYDIDQVGKLSRQEFVEMIRSLLELSSASLERENLDQVVESMFTSAGLKDKDEVTLEDFQRLFGKHKDALGYAQLHIGGTAVQPPAMGRSKRDSAFRRTRETVLSLYGSLDDDVDSRLSTTPEAEIEVIAKESDSAPHPGRLARAERWLETERLTVFWVVLYTLVMLGIFAERSYYYSVEREHAGLRRIAGYGVTVTRGAASAMMFTYSCLLVTMCRNLITFCRETFLHRFVPFDSAIFLHKYIAAWALLWSLVHTIGHGVNFYHISTQAPGDLTCLFRDYFRSSDVLPKFHYWCWETITGLTGVFLLLNMAVLYIFALQYARRHVFKGFWITHNTYPLFYILTVLHGSGRLVQEPFFYYFFLGPCVLFVLDRLVSVSRKKVEISVVKAELLPSAVTALHFKRPSNFVYKSGQWVRIACLPLNSSEYHPFTLSSAPHEKYLSLHIRAVGPWTRNLRRLYDPTVIRGHPLPKIYLDGPYGEGHQDWYRFEVSVLVGGGIGVTPFASILKDIVRRSAGPSDITCKKVYFLWVTRTQKHFEWMVDIIRDVENSDPNHLVSTHIFITQFYSKFDLRTTMLYICERHFQKVSHKSLFTGLRSITHFGRPDLTSIFTSLKRVHPQVEKFGVFSCGPPPMTRSVEDAAQTMNRADGATFHHHFENF